MPVLGLLETQETNAIVFGKEMIKNEKSVCTMFVGMNWKMNLVVALPVFSVSRINEMTKFERGLMSLSARMP